MVRNLLIYTLLLLLVAPCGAASKKIKGKPLSSTVTSSMSDALTKIAQREIRVCPVKVLDARVVNKRVVIKASVTFSYYPFREGNIRFIKDTLRTLLPEKYRSMAMDIFTEGQKIEDFIPQYYRTSNLSKAPSKKSKKNKQVTLSRRFIPEKNVTHPLVRRTYGFAPEKGLAHRHIAMWQSHGLYFKPMANEWMWQRSMLWQTVEDLYTQSYVLEYLVPMLERAGATVLLPRERDFHREEYIVDNDGGSSDTKYREHKGRYAWTNSVTGFSFKEVLLSGENPFVMGTSRQAQTVQSVKQTPSTAIWRANILQDGEYALYVSYTTVKESIPDAHYTVHDDGADRTVLVNQRMGGGTWIYLGTFFFRKGEHDIVSLSNLSSEKGVVTADAVKLGGGMGNIARFVKDSLRKFLPSNLDFTPRTSGYPRFAEGSRYFLQWAGFSRDVYTPKHDGDDYKDDYMSRGRWVNALCGGSEVAPATMGLKIPIDMALAFHSDAGITQDSTIIGTLGIFFTHQDGGKFENEVSRYTSRDLTDMVMSHIVSDLRRTVNPKWSRRGMWNKKYYEARLPKVPTMLLELLSHQNAEDMRYGQDPEFKFIVSRAIYKAILRHISAQYSKPYVVAPLPVKEFSIDSLVSDKVYLSWKAQTDSLEKSAAPSGYMVYTRQNGGGFDKGVFTKKRQIVLKQKPGTIYSYKVTAVNQGGESFDSEILSAATSFVSSGCILAVNGYTMLASAHYENGSFHNDFFSGAPLRRDVAFIGEQRVRDLALRREKNELYALGCSANDVEAGVVAGNTFDYPSLSAQGALRAGYSFFSTSIEAFRSKPHFLSKADMIYLILGKQHSVSPWVEGRERRYELLDSLSRMKLEEYMNSGGRLLVSGSYIGYELFESPYHSAKDVEFGRKMLHIDYVEQNNARSFNRITTKNRAMEDRLVELDLEFSNDYNEHLYRVDRSDAVKTADRDARILGRYVGTRLGCIIGYRGGYNSIVMTTPLEAVKDSSKRDALFASMVNYLFGMDASQKE